jgi:CRP/FNR family transcriptional regulator, dissimilatory nitrate respiration regulator
MSQNLKKIIPTFLSKVSLFSDLTEKQCLELAKHSLLREFEKNKPIFYENDTAEGLYIIFTGKVKVFKASEQGKEQTIHIFKQFEMFGEAALFEGGNLPVNCSTLENSTILIIPKNALLNLIANEPDIALKMLAIQAKKLRFLAKSIEELTLIDAEQRLAKYLLFKAEVSGQESFKLDLSKTALASVLGTSRENLSRILSKLQNASIIKLDGNKLTLLDRKKLAV